MVFHHLREHHMGELHALLIEPMGAKFAKDVFGEKTFGEACDGLPDEEYDRAWLAAMKMCLIASAP
jgi:hypothetical protein